MTIKLTAFLQVSTGLMSINDTITKLHWYVLEQYAVRYVYVKTLYHSTLATVNIA